MPQVTDVVAITMFQVWKANRKRHNFFSLKQQNSLTFSFSARGLYVYSFGSTPIDQRLSDRFRTCFDEICPKPAYMLFV